MTHKARGEKVACKCEGCGAEFSARVADRARGWGRYCSKTCKANNPHQSGLDAVEAARVAMGKILELDECYFGAQARILEAKALAREAMEGLA